MSKKKRNSHKTITNWNFAFAKEQIKKSCILVYKKYEKELTEIAELTRPLMQTSLKGHYAKMAKTFYETIKSTKAASEIDRTIFDYHMMAKEMSKSSALFDIEKEVKEAQRVSEQMKADGKSEEEIKEYMKTTVEPKLVDIKKSLDDAGLITEDIELMAKDIVDEVHTEEKPDDDPDRPILDNQS